MTLQSMTQAQAEPVPVHGMSVLLSRDQLPEARRITGAYVMDPRGPLAE